MTIMRAQLLQCSRLASSSRLISINRCYSSSENEGIKYFGFTYYPRFPGHKDPPYEPTKLFMVERIKPVKGNPYWHKAILKQLGLGSDKGKDVTIVKNIPESNARLWQIKHLVRITPITFPNGMPKEGDYEGTYLKENGEFVVSPRLKVDQERIREREAYNSDMRRFDPETLKKLLRLKWLNGY